MQGMDHEATRRWQRYLLAVGRPEVFMDSQISLSLAILYLDT